jgi:hypothetical protein
MVTPPLSQQQLMEISELAGEAVVTAVSGDAARLRFRRITKGRIRGNGLLSRLGLLRSTDMVLSREGITHMGEPVLGSWSEELRPGDQVVIHLVFSDAAYRTPVWNAIRILSPAKAPGR